MAVATNISKALMEITGEPRPDIAILEIITDAVEHRIEKVKAGIKTYEKKYGMTFEKFKERFEKGETANIYSYNVETDYLEWEGLISRLKKYNSLLNTIH